MHQVLGTSKTFIDRLLDAAKEIRHGDRSGPALKTARKNKDAMLDISREVLARAFKREFPGYL